MAVTITSSGCYSAPIVIGRRGENEVKEVNFDYSDWISEYGDGAITLLVKRKGDTSAYPVALTTADGIATWTVSDTDTSVKGYGKCEWVYTVGTKVAKSVVLSIYVDNDIGDASDTPPDPYETWVDTLTQLGAETLQNATDAAQSATDAAQSATDAAASATAAETAATNAAASATAAQEAADSITGMTVEAETLEPGSAATASWDGDTLTLGIPQGEKGDTGATGAKGDKGDTGATGADGYSPTATVTQQDGVTTISITDKDGTTTAELHIDATLSISGDAADAKATGEAIDDVKSAFENAENLLGIVEGFEGVNAAITVDGNIVTATKENAGSWYAFGVKNSPLSFVLNNVEYMPIGYGTSPDSQNYVFFLAVITNTTGNFGKGYVFAQNITTGALGGDRALYTTQILNPNAVYSPNAAIDYSFNGTLVTIVYNGLSNTIDLSSIPVSTSISGNFSVPMIGCICHSSVQGNSYTLTYDTTLKTLTRFNRWNGKTWCSFGDSITAYGYFQPLVLSELGLSSYTNMGVGASTIAELYSGQSAAFCNRYATIADGFDLITIIGGTNDFGKNVPLGNKGSTDKTTFYGGLEALLTGIKTKFPTTPILFFTPLQRDYFGTAEETSGMINSNGNTLREYRDIIIDLCADAGIPCFDLYGMSDLYPENVHIWTLDGLHPNQTFWNTHYQLISDFIQRYMPTA